MPQCRSFVKAFASIILFSSGNVLADEPVFSCVPPLSPQKTEICQSNTLGSLDQIYQRVVDVTLADVDARISPSRRNTLTTNQRSWLNIPRTCLSAPIGFERCLTNTYLNEIRRMQADSDAAAKVETPFRPSIATHCGDILKEVTFTYVDLEEPLLFYQADGWGGILTPLDGSANTRFVSELDSTLIIDGKGFRGSVSAALKDERFTIEAFGLPETDCEPI